MSSKRIIVGPRAGSMRDRRGRGRRGPLSLPGPLTPRRIPNQKTGIREFDAIVARELRLLAPRLATSSVLVQVVIEDVPNLPDVWNEPIPQTLTTPIQGGVRLVVFRKPIMSIAKEHGLHLPSAVHFYLTQELARLWGRSHDELL